MHKNIPKVNQIWRSCEHLSSYLKRIEVSLLLIVGRTRVPNCGPQYVFESRESTWCR